MYGRNWDSVHLGTINKMDQTSSSWYTRFNRNRSLLCVAPKRFALGLNTSSAFNSFSLGPKQLHRKVPHSSEPLKIRGFPKRNWAESSNLSIFRCKMSVSGRVGWHDNGNSPFSNRRCIFKWLFLHCHVGFRGCSCLVDPFWSLVAFT